MLKMCICRIGGFQGAHEISSPQALADRLFVTMYMGTINSTTDTAQRAKHLAHEIGAFHFQIAVDPVVSALVALFVTVTGGLRTYATAHVAASAMYHSSWKQPRGAFNGQVMCR